jgi:hypothetical protein
MSTEQVTPPLPLAEINVPAITVDAAYAEGEVWNAAALLVNAGVVSAELMQSPKLREAADAASSAILKTEVVGPTVYAELSDLISTGEAVVLPINPYQAVSGVVEHQLSKNRIRHGAVAFTGEEVAALQQEGAYAAMDIHTVMQDFAVREVLNTQADASEFHIATIQEANGFKYRMEYTVNEQGVTYRRTPLMPDGTTTASLRPTTGRLEAEDFTDLCAGMTKGGIRQGRVWGAWADMAEAGPTLGDTEYTRAVTDLHAASTKVLTDAATHGAAALPKAEARHFEKQGVQWVLRAEGKSTSAHRENLTVTFDGSELVLTRRLFQYNVKGQLTSVMEDVYSVGSTPTHTRNSYMGERNYKKGEAGATIPHTLQTADILKLAGELNDIKLPEVQWWQRQQR